MNNANPGPARALVDSAIEITKRLDSTYQAWIDGGDIEEHKTAAADFAGLEARADALDAELAALRAGLARAQAALDDNTAGLVPPLTDAEAARWTPPDVTFLGVVSPTRAEGVVERSADVHTASAPGPENEIVREYVAGYAEPRQVIVLPPWTRNIPTKPGLYRYRGGDGKIVWAGVEAGYHAGTFFVSFLADEMMYDLAELDGLWQGPVVVTDAEGAKSHDD